MASFWKLQEIKSSPKRTGRKINTLMIGSCYEIKILEEVGKEASGNLKHWTIINSKHKIRNPKMVFSSMGINGLF
jgi:hypothetical protein